jgi:hypothetical protein
MYKNLTFDWTFAMKKNASTLFWAIYTENVTYSKGITRYNQFLFQDIWIAQDQMYNTILIRFAFIRFQL